jgi:hypothetical protein
LPFIAPPQQSPLVRQSSPFRRHPVVTWQTLPPVDVVAHTRLQHSVPALHESPATLQPPTLDVGRLLQVPALEPLGMVHRPVQQSRPRKQMSPVARQLVGPPAPTHFPPLQRPEQHSALPLQSLPSVVQPPETIGWQLPPTQLTVQHSRLAAHELPTDLHCIALQVPPMQVLLQQSVGTLHGIPVAAHMPPTLVQMPMLVSHDPEQHPALVVQTSPFAPQDPWNPPSGRSPPSMSPLLFPPEPEPSHAAATMTRAAIAIDEKSRCMIPSYPDSATFRDSGG